MELRANCLDDKYLSDILERIHMTLEFKQNVSLKPYNTFDVEAEADFFYEVTTEQELQEALEQKEDLPLLVLGGGSNVLFTQNFSGLVLRMDLKGITVVQETAEQVTLKVMAGEVWHDLVLHTLKNNWGGLENLSLIPGSVGACPIQNIGAYGVEAKDTIEAVEVMEVASGQSMIFSPSDCEFGYRDSYFKREGKGKYIITAVTFVLQKNPTPNIEYRALQNYFDKRLKDAWASPITIQDVSEAVVSIRQSKLPDPKFYGNAGSFFKNPIIERLKLQPLLYKYKEVPFFAVDEKHVKIPAGWLVETAGWKGIRHGDVGVHKDQALVIINYDKATGAQVRDFGIKISQDVEHKFGIKLEPEVNIL